MNVMLKIAILILSANAAATYCDVDYDGHFKYIADGTCDTEKAVLKNNVLNIFNYR